MAGPEGMAARVSSWAGFAGTADQAGMYPETVNGPEGECSAAGGEVATGAERGMGTDTLGIVGSAQVRDGVCESKFTDISPFVAANTSIDCGI
ncbi:hypothetical protein Aph01nite_30210 [Acrocarpospora phusangensis]|uniref:Uncharacterized protein n=1 Tax=Acrocarpospora phusangensis TaxID=1070424 RepID=A0A919QAZ9_9ACTN|nr:hypothetical protein Aph01nite_30210 [Acrocarpospora phusangensis]